jgi:hypothetical protein
LRTKTRRRVNAELTFVSNATSFDSIAPIVPLMTKIRAYETPTKRGTAATPYHQRDENPAIASDEYSDSMG